jgi:hypothetical protein
VHALSPATRVMTTATTVAPRPTRSCLLRNGRRCHACLPTRSCWPRARQLSLPRLRHRHSCAPPPSLMRSRPHRSLRLPCPPRYAALTAG